MNSKTTLDHFCYYDPDVDDVWDLINDVFMNHLIYGKAVIVISKKQKMKEIGEIKFENF